MIDVVKRAIEREPDAVHALVRALGPVIHGRVVKALVKRAQGRDVFQEVEDLVQEVFMKLFENDAKILRAWDPARGPIGGFVALLADHHVFSVFRSGKRRPWTADVVALEEDDDPACSIPSAESRAVSQESLDGLLDRLKSELSAKGFEVFVRLYVHEQPIHAAAETLGMTVDALYVWRTRLSRLVRTLAAEIEEAERVESRRMSETRLARSTSSAEAS